MGKKREELGRKRRRRYESPRLWRVSVEGALGVLAACKTRGGLRSWGHKCDNLQGHCINRKQGS